MPPARHEPVLLAEVLEGLNPQPGGVFVDGTLGGGGHARAVAERIGPTGRVVGVDRDPAAIAAAEKNLAGLPIKLIQANYCELPEVLEEIGDDSGRWNFARPGSVERSVGRRCPEDSVSMPMVRSI